MVDAFGQLGYSTYRIEDIPGCKVEVSGFDKCFKREVAACACKLWVIPIKRFEQQCGFRGRAEVLVDGLDVVKELAVELAGGQTLYLVVSYIAQRTSAGG